MLKRRHEGIDEAVHQALHQCRSAATAADDENALHVRSGRRFMHTNAFLRSPAVRQRTTRSSPPKRLKRSLIVAPSMAKRLDFPNNNAQQGRASTLVGGT